MAIPAGARNGTDTNQMMDKEEFRAFSRPSWPKDYTDEDFERDWTEFLVFMAIVEQSLTKQTYH